MRLYNFERLWRNLPTALVAGNRLHYYAYAWGDAAEVRRCCAGSLSAPVRRRSRQLSWNLYTPHVSFITHNFSFAHHWSNKLLNGTKHWNFATIDRLNLILANQARKMGLRNREKIPRYAGEWMAFVSRLRQCVIISLRKLLRPCYSILHCSHQSTLMFD